MMVHGTRREVVMVLQSWGEIVVTSVNLDAVAKSGLRSCPM